MNASHIPKAFTAEDLQTHPTAPGWLKSAVG